MAIKSTIFFIIFLYHISTAFSQVSDTPSKESISINEATILKETQQKQIDSLVKIQLNRQLLEAKGNQSKTKELEKKLATLAYNDSLRIISQSQEIANLKKHATPYPVVLNQDTLFNIFTRTGSFSARERAAGISKKVGILYQDAFFSPDSLQIRRLADNADIVYKDQEIILSVSALDGLWYGKTIDSLAQDYLHAIKSNVIREREEHSIVNWIKRIGLSLLIFASLIIIIRGINWLFAIFKKKIIQKSGKFTRGISLGSVNIVAAKDLELIFIKIINGIKLIITLLIIYLSLPLLFSVFPETEGWTGTLLNWVLGPLKIALAATANYLPNLFTIIVIFFLFRFTLKGIRYFFEEVKVGNIRIGGFHEDWSVPTFNILRFILYAFMLVIIFPYLPGSGSAAFQGVSVFLGILISLGSSSAITNIVAGLVITYMRPFKIGDRVKIGEVTGDVIEKTMLVTRVRTIKNEDITVPNSMVLSTNTVNFSSQGNPLGLIINYEVTVGYDVPWRDVYELLIAAALKTIHIESEPKPFVLQRNLNDFYVSYQINAYTHQASKQAAIYSNLLENIQDELNAAGIDLLSPSYNIIRKE
ncbi:MAG: mechanosensitive ion channel family protein [Pedobacter sp.]|nr:MAG: mechanosensitive ion channel family protein [Pedobacter sp.]